MDLRAPSDFHINVMRKLMRCLFEKTYVQAYLWMQLVSAFVTRINISNLDLV